jgi:ethanolamine transporter EutH
MSAPKPWDTKRAMLWGAAAGSLFAAFTFGHEWMAAAQNPNHINVPGVLGNLLGGIIPGAILGGLAARVRNSALR